MMMMILKSAQIVGWGGEGRKSLKFNTRGGTKVQTLTPFFKILTGKVLLLNTFY